MAPSISLRLAHPDDLAIAHGGNITGDGTLGQAFVGKVVADAGSDAAGIVPLHHGWAEGANRNGAGDGK